MKLHTECKCCLTLDVCKMIYTLYKPYTKVCKVTHFGQITHFVQDYTLCCIAYKVLLNRECKIITHYYIFLHSFWKNLHRTEKIYTGTACGACDKYEVCVWTVTSLLDLQVIVGDFWQQNSGQRIISPSVGKVALAFVATIEAALAKAADAFLKSLALLVARQHHRLR